MQTPWNLQCSSHPIVYTQYSLSAGMKLTSIVLQTGYTDVLPALTHLGTWRPPSMATRLKPENSWLLVFRKNEKQKSFFQPFIALLFTLIFLSSVPKSTSGCSIITHTQSHLDMRRRQGAQSWNFTTVYTLQKGTVPRRRLQLGLLIDSSGKALWKTGNS